MLKSRKILKRNAIWALLRSIWKTDKKREWKDIPYKWDRINRGLKGESVFEAWKAVGLEWMTNQVLKEGLVLDTRWRRHTMEGLYTSANGREVKALGQGKGLLPLLSPISDNPQW